MIDLPGYRIDETLHAGLHFTIYRGVRLDDDASVIVKVDDAPSRPIRRRAPAWSANTR